MRNPARRLFLRMAARIGAGLVRIPGANLGLDQMGHPLLRHRRGLGVASRVHAGYLRALDTEFGHCQSGVVLESGRPGLAPDGTRSENRGSAERYREESPFSGPLPRGL